MRLLAQYPGAEGENGCWFRLNGCYFVHVELATLSAELKRLLDGAGPIPNWNRFIMTRIKPS